MAELSALILLSGGLDSAVSAAMMKERGYDISTLLVEYGQSVAEKKAADEIGYWLNPRGKWIARVPSIGADLSDRSNYYPGRNMVLLSVAASIAEQRGIKTIVIGCNADDAAEYPDCRIEFIQAFNQVLREGTRLGIAIEAPVIELTKRRVVQQAHRLKIPIELTFSCYHPKGDAPCGQCSACDRRAAGVKDE